MLGVDIGRQSSEELRTRNICKKTLRQQDQDGSAEACTFIRVLKINDICTRHTDWYSPKKALPSLWLVSSSLDAQVRYRGRLQIAFPHHLHSFSQDVLLVVPPNRSLSLPLFSIITIIATCPSHLLSHLDFLLGLSVSILASYSLVFNLQLECTFFNMYLLMSYTYSLCWLQFKMLQRILIA